MTSRPKLLVRLGPVMVAHSLPAGFDRQCGGRARSDQLGCGRPLRARPAPGPLFLFRLLFAQVVRQCVGRFPCTLACSVYHVHGACSLCSLPAGSFRLLIAR